MVTALISVALTFSVWFCAALGLFLGFGYTAGVALERRFPLDGTRLPRKGVLWGCVIGAGFIGMHGATQIAVTQSVLALGDSLVTGQIRLATPFTDTPGGRISLRGVWSDAGAAYDEEREELATRGLLAYGAQKIVLGDLREPLLAGRTYAKAIRDGSGNGLRGRSVQAWSDARPELRVLALRKLLVTALLNLSFLLVVTFPVYLFLRLTYDELRPAQPESLESVAARARNP
jgi:hypothetical protein